MPRKTVELFWNSKMKKQDDLVALGNKYFRHLQLINNSPGSVISKQIHLKAFVIWCWQREINYPAEVTSILITIYQTYLAKSKNPKNNRPFSAGHRKNRICAISSFFKWLFKNYHILQDPTECVVPIKLAKRLPRNILTAKEMEKVMLQPNLSTLKGMRDRTLLELAYSTAMRRKELHSLDISDINFERNTILIRDGKGQKDRTVPLGKRAKYWLLQYLKDIRPLQETDPSEEALFLNKNGTRIHYHRVSTNISQHIKSAKLGKTGSCHTIRHSVATLMLENGAEIRYIQELLGHSKLDTTQIYTRVSIIKLKEIHTKTHPARMYPTKTKQILSEIAHKQD